MEDRADLARLAFRVRALAVELEELEYLLNEVVAPRMRDATTSLRAIRAQLQELAGMERIDLEAAARVVDDLRREVAAGVDAGPDAEG
ncbi:MAG TPA: hypothetical protein VLC95_01505 [Anaerolineae bacterium]|nr:hypothetical protein [Anaerolineae bacterium]